MANSSQVAKLYKTVVEDVINNVKDAFLDEGVDEQVLLELKQLWDSKLAASKALEPPPNDAELMLGHGMLQHVRPMQAGVAMPQGASAQQQPQQIQSNQQYQQTPVVGATNVGVPPNMFQQQQIATIGPSGQIQNITVQQTGTGQFVTLTPQQIPQFQQLLQQQQQQQQHHQQQQQQQPQQRQLAPQITQQMLQQRQQLLQQQQQQQQQHHQQVKLVPGTQILRTAQPGQAQNIQNIVQQLDGPGDTSSDDDDDDDDLDDDKDDDPAEEVDDEGDGEEEEPLNSADDVSEEDDPNELFDTENVVVCQYDKINRNKNKWKFYLKDGIMSLNGRDFVFQKASGDAEW